MTVLIILSLGYVELESSSVKQISSFEEWKQRSKIERVKFFKPLEFNCFALVIFFVSQEENFPNLIRIIAKITQSLLIIDKDNSWILCKPNLYLY